ncbi:protein I'm not dead yet-like [Diachasmimorpha longicaudata]|uniref:protein I'm not dead yet-like n=1 Tax=Diachasmimorpha longicaudata TaxID=58733 RepID=UPI0030B8FFA3
MNESNEDSLFNSTFRQRTVTFLRIYWRSIIAICWPIALLPLPLTTTYKETKCAYVIIIMAMFWITEIIPPAITSLLPIVLFPFFGILDSREVSECYMNDTIMVFIGGLVLAIAVEHCNLHFRIALTVMRYVGCSHGRLLGGLCAVTGFLSMWISNTATCAMMIPIVFAILEELEKGGSSKVFHQLATDPEDPDPLPMLEPTNTTKAYLLTVAYTSTFGGTITVVGTGTNLIFKGIYEQTFPGSAGIGFTQWLTWAFPLGVVNVFLTWVYTQVFYLGLFRPRSFAARAAAIGNQGENITNQVIKEKYENLGPITFHQTGVGILFLFCVFLWFFRSPGFMTGWAGAVSNSFVLFFFIQTIVTEIKNSIFNNNYINILILMDWQQGEGSKFTSEFTQHIHINIEIGDSAPVILTSLLLFFLPKYPGFIRGFSDNPRERPAKPSESLITWNVVNSKMPWNLMFLLGGGFAISRGSNQSCLSKRIGSAMTPLRALPPFVTLVIVCLFIGTVTEITSNIGIANIMLPVVAQMSIALKQHPLYLLLPATMCCSHTFRLPVGTPPNAIVSTAGHIPIKSMIAGGCIPAVYSFLSLIIIFSTWGVYIYDIHDFPEWAAASNNTSNGQCD